MSTMTETRLPTCYRHPDRETGLSCPECGRPICTECMTPAAVGLRCPEHAGTRRRVAPPRIVRRTSRGATDALATRVLIAINVAIYLIGASQGHGIDSPGGALYQKFWLDAPDVSNGGWWRLITAAFLHANIIHIGFNMWALWVIGGPVENYLGRARYLALYFVSGLAGSAGALLLTPLAVTLGASGAIFGILGALLIIEWQTTGRLAGTAMTWIVINLVLTFAIANISIGGHIGGLIGGILVTLAFANWGRGHAAYGRVGAIGVTGAERGARDRRAVVELRVGVARDRETVGAIDVPDEPGAVEAPGREAAPEVVRAEEAPRLRDDGCIGRRERPRRAGEHADAVRRADAVAAERRERRPVAETEGAPVHVQRSEACRDDERRPSAVEVGRELRDREPAGIAVRVLRVGLVHDRDLRPRSAAGEDHDLLAVERLGLHMGVEPDARRRRREVAAPLRRVGGIRERRAVDPAREVRRLPERRDRDVYRGPAAGVKRRARGRGSRDRQHRCSGHDHGEQCAATRCLTPGDVRESDVRRREPHGCVLRKRHVWHRGMSAAAPPPARMVACNAFVTACWTLRPRTVRTRRDPLIPAGTAGGRRPCRRRARKGASAPSPGRAPRPDRPRHAPCGSPRASARRPSPCRRATRGGRPP